MAPVSPLSGFAEPRPQGRLGVVGPSVRPMRRRSQRRQPSSPPKLSTGQPPTTPENWPKSRKTPIFQKISGGKGIHRSKQARPRPSPSPGVPHWTPHQCNPPGSVERLRRDKDETSQAHRDAKEAEKEHDSEKPPNPKSPGKKGSKAQPTPPDPKTEPLRGTEKPARV